MIEVTKDGRIICTKEDMTALRLAVAKRANFYCENCVFKHVGWDEGHLHHVIARAMGGANRNDVEENLMWLCGMCHEIDHHPANFELQG